jgi:hypothetical protein
MGGTRMRTASLMVLMLSAVGCGHEFVKEDRVMGKGIVYVYRPSKFLGAAVNLAGTIVSSSTQAVRSFPVRNNKYVALYVDPGPTVVSVSAADGKAFVLPVDLQGGNEVAVRCELVSGGWVGHAQCNPVPINIAVEEISTCKKNVNAD